MTAGELYRKLSQVPGDTEVKIYNNGNFDIEDAWVDRGVSPRVFAIQVIPQEGADEP